jgi:predicted Abi (CAAX) family protease
MRLSRPARRGLLVLHLVSAGAWIGIDVMVAVLVLTGRFAADVALRSLAYRALAAFVTLPMLVSGLVCLATGVVLGLGTKWGLVRYWWVAVKLVLNVVLCALIVVVLQPGMDGVAVYGEDLLTGNPSGGRVSDLFFPPAVSLSCLTFATVLSVAKPWGRRQRTPRPAKAA